MARKMYYTEMEAVGKLGITMQELSAMVKDQKLRVFMDGAHRMFKVEDVDAAASKDAGEVQLTPAEPVSIKDADTVKPAGKGDTVITAEGISIFDNEDLEIAADPMAKTQIAPSMEDKASLEGVGHGSGLLDLTRESDDTSLGAEVLDHIDMESVVGSGIAAEAAGATPQVYAPQHEAYAVESSAAEIMDAPTGAFNGITVALAAVAILIGMVSLAAAQGVVPGFLEGIKANLTIVLAAIVVVIGVAAGMGYMMGKSLAARQTAMKRVGG